MRRRKKEKAEEGNSDRKIKLRNTWKTETKTKDEQEEAE